MFCSKCGQELSADSAFCNHCGSPVNGQPAYRPYSPEAQTDAPSSLFAVLGFFFPLVGLILYLVYESKSPLKARSAGKGALIGFIVGVVLSAIAMILFSFGMSAFVFNVTDSFLEREFCY